MRFALPVGAGQVAGPPPVDDPDLANESFAAQGIVVEDADA